MVRLAFLVVAALDAEEEVVVDEGTSVVVLTGFVSVIVFWRAGVEFLSFCSRSSWMILCVSESAGSIGIVSRVGSAFWARRPASLMRSERTIAVITTTPSMNESDVAAGFFMGDW